MKIYPLTKTDSQLLALYQWKKMRLITKKQMERAILKLREERIMQENMYQGRSYEV